MTHGCIAVRRSDEERQVLLHTYHSGQFIDDNVKSVCAFHAENRWGFLANRWKDYPSMERLKEGVSNLAFDDGMFYQPSVAALLIANRPWNLEVVQPEFRPDLASWSGIEHPYVLLMNEDTNIWELYDEEGKVLFALDPTEEMLKHVWAKISRAARLARSKSHKRSPRPRRSGTKVKG